MFSVMSCGVSDLERELACPICLELYSAAQGSSPKILVACGHTICENCVQYKILKLPEGLNNSVKCPICNSQTTKRSATDLPTNFSLREVASKFAKLDDGYRICLSCQNRHVEATFWYCQQCESENPEGVSWACSHCAIKYHKDHNLIEFETMKMQKEEIQKRIWTEKNVVEEKLTQVMDSSRESVEIQKMIGDLLHQSLTQQFKPIQEQMNANHEILSSGLGGLVILEKKAKEIRTELEEACRETIEAQTQARQVLNRCLNNLHTRIQKVKDANPNKEVNLLYDPYITVNIVAEGCFIVHQGFDLMDPELAEATAQKFCIRKQANMAELYKIVAQHYKVKPLKEFRLWNLVMKNGKILRPSEIILTSPIGDQPIKVEEQLREDKVFLWMELYDVVCQAPHHKFNSDSDVLVFLKFYDPKQSLITFCGHMVLRLNSQLREVIPELCRRAQLPGNSEVSSSFVEVFEEMEPGRVEPRDVDIPFKVAFAGPMLDNGLILVFQQTPIPSGVPFPTAANYFNDLFYRVEVEFINKEDPSAPKIPITASQIWQYDQVVAALSQKINLDPQKIQLHWDNHYKDPHGQVLIDLSDPSLHIMLGLGSQPCYIPPHKNIRHQIHYCLNK